MVSRIVLETWHKECNAEKVRIDDLRIPGVPALGTQPTFFKEPYDMRIKSKAYRVGGGIGSSAIQGHDQGV